MKKKSLILILVFGIFGAALALFLHQSIWGNKVASAVTCPQNMVWVNTFKTPFRT